MPEPVQIERGPPDRGLLALVEAFLAAHAGPVGPPALSEPAREGLAAGVGETLLVRGDDGALLGVGRLVPVAGSWQFEMVVDGDADGPSPDAGRRLLEAARAEAARAGGGRVHYWVRRPDDASDRQATAAGFTVERRLLQLRVPLPLPPDQHRGRSVPVRAFRPGVDEAAWLDVNNRAFAGHPEQGGWDLATLLGREAEPWFDPEGFLVAEGGRRLLGFCWTKVHPDPDDPLGEIYVIAVDPDAHQRGLGRALTVAGLDWLAAAGLPTGMLYVDADNLAATSLYRSLGFTVDHAELAYVAEADPGGAAR